MLTCAIDQVWTLLWLFMFGSFALTFYAYYRAGLVDEGDLAQFVRPSCRASLRSRSPG